MIGAFGRFGMGAAARRLTERSRPTESGDLGAGRKAPCFVSDSSMERSAIAEKIRYHEEQSSFLTNERGNAIIEFLLCFPFVLMVFMCSIDLGRALNSYFTITRIVYEGTRYAGQVAGLESGTYPDFNSTTGKPGHRLVRARVDQLLFRYSINPGTLDPTYLETKMTLRNTSIVNDRDRVYVSLTIPFEPLFPICGLFLNNLTANSTGPYLFS